MIFLWTTGQTDSERQTVKLGKEGKDEKVNCDGRYKYSVLQRVAACWSALRCVAWIVKRDTRTVNCSIFASVAWIAMKRTVTKHTQSICCRLVPPNYSRLSPQCILYIVSVFVIHSFCQWWLQVVGQKLGEIQSGSEVWFLLAIQTHTVESLNVTITWWRRQRKKNYFALVLLLAFFLGWRKPTGRAASDGAVGSKPPRVTGKAWAGYAWRELHGRTLEGWERKTQGHSCFYRAG